jgi:hypothetical protein
MVKKIFFGITLAAYIAGGSAWAHEEKATNYSEMGVVDMQGVRIKGVRGKGARMMFRVIPRHMSYQGYLTDDSGNSINGNVIICFSIWTDPDGGLQLWTGVRTVTVEDGNFNIVLGTAEAIPDSVFDSGELRWLQLMVEGQPMQPRAEITNAVYVDEREKAEPPVSHNTYDSGWFAVKSLTNYKKNHNLGTTKCLVSIYIAENEDGSGRCAMISHNHCFDAQTNIHSGTWIYEHTPSHICIASSDRLCQIKKQGEDWFQPTSAFARIVMLALEQ